MNHGKILLLYNEEAEGKSNPTLPLMLVDHRLSPTELAGRQCQWKAMTGEPAGRAGDRDLFSQLASHRG